MVRESSLENFPACHVDVVQKGLRGSLFFPVMPESVTNEESVEYVRADVEGIVRLEVPGHFRFFGVDNFARDKHADCFAADETRAYHTATYS